MEILDRLLLSAPLFLISMTAWSAGGDGVPVGSTGWSVEAPAGFGKAKAEGVPLRLEGRPAASGPLARIEVLDGWRVDPLMCPDKNGDPVRPIGRSVRKLDGGKAIYVFTCADAVSPGAYESRRIALRGMKLEDRHGSLGAALTFVDVRDGRTIYLPHGQVDPALRDWGLAAFEKTVASLHLAADDLSSLKAPLQPASVSTSLAPLPAIAK